MSSSDKIFGKDVANDGAVMWKGHGSGKTGHDKFNNRWIYYLLIWQTKEVINVAFEKKLIKSDGVYYCNINA